MGLAKDGGNPQIRPFSWMQAPAGGGNPQIRLFSWTQAPTGGKDNKGGLVVMTEEDSVRFALSGPSHRFAAGPSPYTSPGVDTPPPVITSIP
jgi:hypothetical protein